MLIPFFMMRIFKIINLIIFKQILFIDETDTKLVILCLIIFLKALLLIMMAKMLIIPK